MGSIQSVTDQSYHSLTTSHLSYDAYGRRRDAGNNTTVLDQNPIADVTKRGFTGQEHVDQLGIINYNARLYDPELGIMLQADTVIPDGPVTQSMNRYSYVFNNPLSYTDPTGHIPAGATFTSDELLQVEDSLGSIGTQGQPTESSRTDATKQVLDNGAGIEGTSNGTFGGHQGNGLGGNDEFTGVNNSAWKPIHERSFWENFKGIIGQIPDSLASGSIRNAMNTVFSDVIVPMVDFTEDIRAAGNCVSNGCSPIEAGSLILGVAGRRVEGVADGIKGLGKLAKGLDDVPSTKPDFIVSPNGTAMSTKKDLNLVDANKSGGEWFQIHNTHLDKKVDGSPHTHFLKQNDLNRNRMIKSTDGNDLDFADKKLKNKIMRERVNRKDKGGVL